jgi:hypothetical protein
MFQVEWLQSALDALADGWVRAAPAERPRITGAADQIDWRLQHDPQNEGESRSAGRRVLLVPPLTVVYRIEPDGQTVTVLQARVFRKRRW